MLNYSIFKKVFILGLIIFIFSFSGFSFAEDFKIPHEFKAGDLLSADVLNEIFNYIKESKKILTTSDLIGTWRCTAIVNPQRKTCDSEWVTHSDGFFHYLEDSILTISDDGDGTYSFQTSSPSMFLCDESGEQSGPALVDYGSLFINPVGDDSQQFIITQVSDTGILLKNPWQSGFINGRLTCAMCNKQNLSPDKPTDLQAASSGFIVRLSWLDNSDDETGFKIVRRDSLTGDYIDIVETLSDIITYEDTVSVSGTYWYRVKATNSNGDSLGSNVIKVTVTE